jgi:hypothetical protein
VKLSSPALERRLRQQARQELRESPLLWKDYRQHKARWWRRNLHFPIGPGVSVYVLSVFFSATVRSGRSLGALTAIALYASGTAIFRCKNYFARATTGYDRAVFIALPVSDHEYIKHESWSLLRSWIGAFSLFGVAYSVYAAVHGRFWDSLAAVLLAATLQTLTGISVGAFVVAFRPKWSGGSTIASFYVLMILCLFIPEDALRFLWSATLVTPAGWVAHGFAGSVDGADSLGKFWLIPAFILSATLPLTLRAFQSRIASALASPDFLEQALSPGSDNSDDTVDDASSAEPIGGWELTAPDDQLHHQSKATAGAQPGWIERLVAALLNSRELVVAEFMLANQLHTWSKKWRSAALITLAGTALTLAAPPLPAWLFFVPMIVAGSLCAPLFGGTWVGFRGPMTSGFYLPAYTVFPLSYSEISWVMLKSNYARALTWAPLAIIYASALAHRLNHSFAYGAEVGVCVVLIIMALQPVMIAGHFSSGTNDTRKLSWQTVLFFSFALALLTIMVIATSMMFITLSLLVELGAITVIFVASSLGWAAYKLLFERGRIDVLSRPRGR